MTLYYHFWFVRVPAPHICDELNITSLSDSGNATSHITSGNATSYITYMFIPATSRSNYTEYDSLLAAYFKFSLVFASVCIVLGPLVLLTVLNFGLVHYIRKSRKFLFKEQSRNEETMASNERKVTVMVCVIVAAFTVFNCPSAVLHLLHLTVSSSDLLPNWHPTAVEVSNALITTGKVLNFVLYCLTNKKFRLHAKDLLMCRDCKRRGGICGSYGCTTAIVTCTASQTSDTQLEKRAKREVFEMKNMRNPARNERVPFMANEGGRNIF